MMEKEKLRKADLFSGGIIMLTGLFIVVQALGMPMKDSWGGVQNVWYVSPAIFPLFVGAVIMLLGALLVRTAVKEVGLGAGFEILGFIFSSKLIPFLREKANVRFFAIITLFLCFVFLLLPRVDFFLAAILFLMTFISMFYFDDHGVLVRLFQFFAIEMTLVFLFLMIGPEQTSLTQYPADWLMLLAILSMTIYTFRVSRLDPVMAKKFRLVMILSFCAPLLIGGVFKYLLLVPMPFEGLVVELLDLVWYYEF